MADLYLSSGNARSAENGDRIFGASGAGTETITVVGGQTGVTVDQNVEVVRLANATGSYTFQQFGNQLAVFSNGTEVSRITLQNDNNGTLVTFANGTVEARVSAAGLTLGGATVSSTAPGAVVPTAIDNSNTPGTTSLNLTNAVGENIVGTAGNDTISAVLSAAGGTDNGTLNVGDTINGAGGIDTLNLLVASGTTGIPAGASVSNVEIVNVNYAGTASLTGLNSNTFGGVQQLWQVDNDTTTAGTFGNVTVGAGVTAGFRSTGATATAAAASAAVTAAAGVTALTVALDGVASGSAITLAEITAAGLSTASVSGSVTPVATAAVPGTPAVPGVDANADGDFTDPGDTAPVAAVPGTPAGTANVLTLTAAATTDIDNLNLSLASNTTVAITTLDDLNTLNASASTGNLTINLGTPDELTSAVFGSGNDTISLNMSALNTTAGAANATASTLAIDLGAGNDVFTLNAAGTPGAVATTINLGAGNDTLALTGLSNITATTAVAADLITVADFTAAQDVLNLDAIGTGGVGTAGRDVLVNTELANISAATTLEAAVGVAASVTTAGQYSIFNYGANAYVFLNNNGAGFDAGDGLMQINGFSVEAITATNFIA
jgi:hypothetical protein